MATKKDILLNKAVEKSKQVHGDFYDYSLINNYESNSIKVPIICPVHGKFEQIMKNHVKGIGCPFCGKKSSGKTRTLDLQRLLDYSRENYENFYTFSKSIYKNADTHILITCPIHGDFEQSPRGFLSGRIGCEKCVSKKDSKLEVDLVEFVSTLVVVERNNRDILNGKEIDIFLPESKVAIEFNGLYWHSSRFKDKYYHLNKTKQCEEKGITLVHIFEDEWKLDKERIKINLTRLINRNSEVVKADDFLTIDRRWNNLTEFIEKGYTVVQELEPMVYTEYDGYPVYDCGILTLKYNA